MIMKYINMDFSEYEDVLDKKIDSDEDYKAARETLRESLSLLDEKTQNKITENATYVEVLSRGIAYDEGFDEGVRFILGCVSSGKEAFHHE